MPSEKIASSESNDAEVAALKKELEEKDTLLNNAVAATKTMNDALLNLALNTWRHL